MERLFPWHSSSSNPHSSVHALLTCVMRKGRYAEQNKAEREGGGYSIVDCITLATVAVPMYVSVSLRD